MNNIYSQKKTCEKQVDLQSHAYITTKESVNLQTIIVNANCYCAIIYHCPKSHSLFKLN